MTAWRKSSYSQTVASDCVEVALSMSEVAVRDSKNSSGPTLSFGVEAWRGLLRARTVTGRRVP
jgi:hypothetical protein